MLILEDEPFSREDFEGVLRVVWWMDELFEDAGGDYGKVETSHDASSVGRVAGRNAGKIMARIWPRRKSSSPNFKRQLGATRIITIFHRYTPFIPYQVMHPNHLPEDY